MPSPSPPPVVPNRPPWADSADYLIASGWEQVGVFGDGSPMWSDPRSHVPQSLQPGPTLPVRGGGTEVVMQMTGPPADWTWNTMDAVYIQRSRDSARASPQRLARPIASQKK